MYTEIGRILSEREARQVYDTIKAIRAVRELCELNLVFTNAMTMADISVKWMRAKPNMGDWEAVGVMYTSRDKKNRDEEIFNSSDKFASAYRIK